MLEEQNKKEAGMPRNTQFNKEEFLSKMSERTRMKLKTYASVEKRLVRDTPPLRGFAVKWTDKPALAEKFIWGLYTKLRDYITSSNLPQDVKESLLTFEEYQSKQKGPTAPVTRDHILTAYNNIAQEVPIELDSQTKGKFLDIHQDLSRYLNQYARYRISSVNFAEEWNKLPSTTVRGYPFNALGKDVDDEIVKLGGRTVQSAIQFAKNSTQDVAFLGWRIQGKPVEEGPKLRPVFIPEVYVQYLSNGIVSKSMSLLKHAPMFAGWQNPEDRHSTILSMLQDAKRDGFKIIQLDYSKFDQRFSEFFRLLALSMEVSHLRDHQEAKEIYQVIEPYYRRQFAMFPAVTGIDGDVGQGKLIVLTNQLLSGRKSTQKDGSVVNAYLQGYIADSLGYGMRWHNCLVLGDDAGFPVPDNLVKGQGYQEVLHKIEEILKPTGFIMNAKKAYPTSELIFLQKLYNIDLGIEGIGSWARSFFSFVYRENLPKKIEGVTSMAALEIISQISIINEAFPFSGVNINDFGKIFAQAWIDEDDGLRLLLQEFSRSGGTAHDFFKYLVKVSGATFDQIADYNDKLAYDHSALLPQLQSSDYGQVFKILPYLLEADYSSTVKTKLKDLFGDYEVAKESDLVDLITD